MGDSRSYGPEKPIQNGWNIGELQLAGSYTTEDSLFPYKMLLLKWPQRRTLWTWLVSCESCVLCEPPCFLQVRMFNSEETITLYNRLGECMGLSVVIGHLLSGEHSFASHSGAKCCAWEQRYQQPYAFIIVKERQEFFISDHKLWR